MSGSSRGATRRVWLAAGRIVASTQHAAGSKQRVGRLCVGEAGLWLGGFWAPAVANAADMRG